MRSRGNSTFLYPLALCRTRTILTKVLQAVACLIESPSVELQPDDGEDEDSKEEKEGDVNQWANSFSDGTHHHLQTYKHPMIVSISNIQI